MPARGLYMPAAEPERALLRNLSVRPLNALHRCAERAKTCPACALRPYCEVAVFDDTIRDLLLSAKHIAVVGANDTPGRPVDGVGRYLLEAGYAVWPVHPARRTVWGLPAVARLADLPQPVDIVNLFRAPEACPPHAREVAALPWKPAAFWMQLGIRSAEAGALLAGLGVAVVEDLCIMVEHRRLCGATRPDRVF